MDIYETPQAAAAQAKADAEAAGVTPMAVMYSSPGGYGVGSEDMVVVTDEPVGATKEGSEPKTSKGDEPRASKNDEPEPKTSKSSKKN